MRYSSSGVREQTAELSSSFLSDSEITRQFSPDSNGLDPTIGHTRRHDTIEETPEVPSPSSSSGDTPPSSALTEALRKESQRRSADSASSATDMHTVSTLPDVVTTDQRGTKVTETTPLLPRERLQSYHKPQPDSEPDAEEQARYQPGTWNRLGHHYPTLRYAPKRILRALQNPRLLLRKVIVEPIFMLPAVFLGLLLNLLDALSYGIILFPLGEEAFKDLGPDGVSMFYVSCIIAQLTYSTGSIFKGGVGSEMIEVVPFFTRCHTWYVTL